MIFALSAFLVVPAVVASLVVVYVACRKCGIGFLPAIAHVALLEVSLLVCLLLLL